MSITASSGSLPVSELLRNVTPGERLKLLRELVKLCFADGSLNNPLRVTEDGDGFAGYISALFPRTTEPFPETTAEEEAETQRRIANRHNAIPHDEFMRRVVSTIREQRGSEQS